VFVILKITTDGIDEFIVYNKLTNLEVACYSTYSEAFKDLLAR
jgi:hypothetical protein